MQVQVPQVREGVEVLHVALDVCAAEAQGHELVQHAEPPHAPFDLEALVQVQEFQALEGVQLPHVAADFGAAEPQAAQVGEVREVLQVPDDGRELEPEVDQVLQGGQGLQAAPDPRVVEVEPLEVVAGAERDEVSDDAAAREAHRPKARQMRGDAHVPGDLLTHPQVQLLETSEVRELGEVPLELEALAQAQLLRRVSDGENGSRMLRVEGVGSMDGFRNEKQKKWHVYSSCLLD